MQQGNVPAHALSMRVAVTATSSSSWRCKGWRVKNETHIATQPQAHQLLSIPVAALTDRWATTAASSSWRCTARRRPRRRCTSVWTPAAAGTPCSWLRPSASRTSGAFDRLPLSYMPAARCWTVCIRRHRACLQHSRIWRLWLHDNASRQIKPGVA